MTDYILLQCKQAKCPLLSMRNNMREYTMRFGGVIMTVNRYYEAWLATTIYSGDRQLTVNFIRSCIPDIAPDEIDGLIKTFKEKHPLTPIEYHYEDIPLMAVDNYYFEIQSPMFPTSVKLTAAQEKDVLDIIISPRIYNKLEKMKQWFSNYRMQYGVESRLKRDRVWQDEELAWHFLLIHGINCNPPVMQRKRKPSETPQHTGGLHNSFHDYFTKLNMNKQLQHGLLITLTIIAALIILPLVAFEALWLFQYAVFVVPAIGIALFVFVAIFMAGRSIKKGDTEQ